MSRPVSTAPTKGRLGMLLKGYPRISESFISNEILLLEEQGFDIHIIAMRPPRETITHESVKRIKAKVTYLPEHLSWGFPRFFWRNALLFCNRPGRYLKGVKLLLSRYSDAPKKHTWLKHFLQAGYLVHKALEKEDVKHLHAHFAHTPTSVAMYAALLADIPFSFTAHAKDIYTESKSRIREKIERAKFVLTCTRYNERYLSELAPPDKRINCVYHGIDLRLFTMNGRKTAAAPPYQILTVARLVEKKGLPDVLNALKLLREQGVDFRYTLIGAGADKQRISALIKELGLDDITEMTGVLPHEQVIERFQRAHVFVLGCRIAENGDRDGIPNVIAESMAMGVPVAATNVSAIPELIKPGETGMLAEQCSPEGLATAIRTLLEDTELRASVIPEARKTVEEVFDNKVLAKRLAEVYHEMGVESQG